MENSTENTQPATASTGKREPVPATVTLNAREMEALFGNGDHEGDLGASALDQIAKDIEVIKDAFFDANGDQECDHALWRLSSRCETLAGIVAEHNRAIRHNLASQSFAALLESVSALRKINDPSDVLWAMTDLAEDAGYPETADLIRKVHGAALSHPHSAHFRAADDAMTARLASAETDEVEAKGDESSDTDEPETSDDDEAPGEAQESQIDGWRRSFDPKAEYPYTLNIGERCVVELLRTLGQKRPVARLETMRAIAPKHALDSATPQNIDDLHSILFAIEGALVVPDIGDKWPSFHAAAMALNPSSETQEAADIHDAVVKILSHLDALKFGSQWPALKLSLEMLESYARDPESWQLAAEQARRTEVPTDD